MFGEIRLSDIAHLQGLRPSKAPHLRVADCQQSVAGMDASGQILPGANFTWHGLPVDVAVAAGARPKQKALDCLKKFSSEKKRLLIYQIEQDWFAFCPPAFQAEIAARIGPGATPCAD